ncbi:MAG: YafY family transcriptional regulator [Firmicutes bacterium HGW-Firmicutes-15]|nr:MAG: YafY family transcriptional regulator [Firmicutes bacterium HGW-Firmicutes-15]
MKIDRLISILVVLLRRERVQAKELAEMFEVSVRTILRDVDTINLAGIPIVTYQGVNGGIGIAEGYRLDKSVLSAYDMAAIITTLKGVSGMMPDSRYDVLMEKLKNPLSSAQLDMIDLKTRQMIIDMSPWGGNEPHKEKIILLRQAIENRNEIEFVYVDAEGTRTRRRVEPYSLILKGKNWYLYAWCILRQDFRLFKLSRIKELLITDKSYQARELPNEQFPWEGEWKNNARMLELDLLFEQEMESIVEEYFDSDMIRQDNGKIMIKIHLPENNWLYAWLLSFGNAVEVINPPHIREIMARTAEEIFKKYTSQT